MLPSGHRFVAASGAPYYIVQFRTDDLAEDGVRYVTDAYPNAVAVTPARGGLVAAGRDATYDPDVDVFAAGDPSRKLLTHDFGDSEGAGPELIDRGLAWSPDGTRLFAVTGESSDEAEEVEFHVLPVP